MSALTFDLQCTWNPALYISAQKIPEFLHLTAVAGGPQRRQGGVSARGFLMCLTKGQRSEAGFGNEYRILREGWYPIQWAALPFRVHSAACPGALNKPSDWLRTPGCLWLSCDIMTSGSKSQLNRMFCHSPFHGRTEVTLLQSAVVSVWQFYSISAEASRRAASVRAAGCVSDAITARTDLSTADVRIIGGGS
ncbi:hypothetical protein JZ751_021830 [Albula glossodonta]|uniref:Uncharacterized protein n=1 Tax=Albula glossodonta TaxID=121402 RepID=A0A8T2MRY9_9TELE|nr:hypothetical protein JZ751_021830 [Albula glossodonta]